MKKNVAILLIMFLAFITPSYALTEGTNKEIKLNKTVKDYLDVYDEVDYFSFDVSKPGSIKIDFDFDVKTQYNVKLINLDTNKTIQNLTFSCEVNTVSGRYEKSSNKIRVEDGEYQIQVSSSNRTKYSDEQYKFIVNYDKESGDNYEKESNNTPQTSNIVDYNRKITGNLESKSDVDYYMVEINRPGTFQIKLQYDKDANYNINVYKDIDGKLSQIQSGKIERNTLLNSYGNVCLMDKLRVSEGNYYIKVSNGFLSNYTDEDYSMTAMYSAENYGLYEKEPNDTANYATEIYTSEMFIGNLSSKSDIDYYYVRAWGGNWYVTMNIPQNSEYNINVYKNVNGKLSQIVSGKINESKKYIEIKEASGDYYIKVASKTYSNEDYTITVLSENEMRIPKTIVLEENNQYMTVDGIKILIDGDRGTTPTIVNGRMLLPIRAVIENLGGKVYWNESTMTMTSELNGKVISMPINSNVAYVNNQTMYLDVPTQTINGRTMVPVRFIMEHLGGNVTWNNNIVTITY